MEKKKGYITIKFTPTEFESVKDAIDFISSMAGGMDDEVENDVKKYIKCFDRAIQRAGYKRNYK